MHYMRRKNKLVSQFASSPVRQFNPPTRQPANPPTKIGFTFIEMLIVTVMVSIISLAIYSTLNNGIKIWQRINRQLPAQDLLIFFDRFSNDLKNSFEFQGISFAGTENTLGFATLVSSARLNNKTVGKVTYSYDRQSEILSRQQQDYSQVCNQEESENKKFINNIKSLSFQYNFYDTKGNSYLWQYGWENEKLPRAVRMELEFDDGKQILKFTKTVSIPVGG